MKEAVNNLPSKSEVKNASNLEDQNEESIKNFKSLIQVLLLVEATLVVMDYKTI